MCFVKKIHYESCSHICWDHRFCDTCHGAHNVEITSGSKDGACEECTKNQANLNRMNQFIIGLYSAIKTAGLGKDTRRKLLAETGKDLIVESDSNNANIAVIVEDVDMDKDKKMDRVELEWHDNVKNLDQALFGSLELLFMTLEAMLEFRRVTVEDVQDLKDWWRHTLLVHASIKEEYYILLQAFYALEKVISTKKTSRVMEESLPDEDKVRYGDCFQRPDWKVRKSPNADRHRSGESPRSAAAAPQQRVRERDSGAKNVGLKKENHIPDDLPEKKVDTVRANSDEIDLAGMGGITSQFSTSSIVPLQ